MSNISVVPSKKEDIDIILSKDIKEIIIGVKDLSIYPFELSIEEVIDIAGNTSKDVVIALNKMMHNKDLSLVSEILSKIKDSKIKKILFYDLGIFNLAKEMGLDKELILGQEHLNASINSNNFYYKKGITNSFITSDITYHELLDIKKNTKMHIYYTVYGYLPIFYSRRYLLTNYFKYIGKVMEDDLYYIYDNNMKYLIKERAFGTIIYSPLVNLLKEKSKIESIDNFVIDLSYNGEVSIIDKFINSVDSTDEEVNNYTGFFDKETIYKLRSGNNE